MSGVVIMHGVVFGAKMAPLEAVDGAQVPLFAVVEAAAVEKSARGVGVPNSHFLIVQFLSKNVRNSLFRIEDGSVW